MEAMMGVMLVMMCDMKKTLDELKEKLDGKKEKYVCPECREEFTTSRALGVHRGRWCPKKKIVEERNETPDVIDAKGEEATDAETAE
jgi:hypothetical protein